MKLFFSGCIVGIFQGIFMTCLWMVRKLDRWKKEAEDEFFKDWGEKNGY